MPLSRTLKQKYYWAAQVTGWGIYASIHLVLWLTSDLRSNAQLANGMASSAFFLFSSHVYRNWLLKSGWLEFRPSKILPRALLASLLLGVCFFVFISLWETATGQTQGEDSQTFSFFFPVAFSTGGIYFLWNVIYLMYHYFDQYRTSLRYEATIKEMELNKLKSQLNPHFMFNALNSIRALVEEEPQKAKDAITQLSHILRSSLIMSKKKLVPLSDEVKTVSDYLALEKIRYEERLHVEINIPESVQQTLVPPMMLQTLAENGIKHGISSLPEGGLIQIKAEVTEKDLQISVRNSGQLKQNDSNDPGSGYGVKNTQERLRLIYTEGASFSLSNEDEETVLALLSLPHPQQA